MSQTSPLYMMASPTLTSRIFIFGMGRDSLTECSHIDSFLFMVLRRHEFRQMGSRQRRCRSTRMPSGSELGSRTPGTGCDVMIQTALAIPQVCWDRGDRNMWSIHGWSDRLFGIASLNPLWPNVTLTAFDSGVELKSPTMTSADA